MVGADVRDVIDAFRDRYPSCDAALHEIHFSDPFAALRAGEVDLALLWRPVREPDLVEGPVLLTEGRAMAMWPGHELAERSSVSLEDFADRLVVDPGPRAPEYWMQAMLPRHTPSGRPVPRGPLVTTFHELLARIAAHECVSPLSEHGPRYYSPPGVLFVPVHDAPITEWALVWRKDALHPRGRGFVEVATQLGPRGFGTVRR